MRSRLPWAVSRALGWDKKTSAVMYGLGAAADLGQAPSDPASGAS